MLISLQGLTVCLRASWNVNRFSLHLYVHYNLSYSCGGTGSSSVNTLSALCSFRMSAFFLGLVNSLPCDFKIAIPAESLRLALIYCQKRLVTPSLVWPWTGSASSISDKLFTYCWCGSCSSLCTSSRRCLSLRQNCSFPLRRAEL